MSARSIGCSPQRVSWSAETVPRGATELTRLEAEIARLRADLERVSRIRAELPALRRRAEDEVRAAAKEVHFGTPSSAPWRHASRTRRIARQPSALETARIACRHAKARLERVRAERAQVERDAALAEAEAERLPERAQELSKRVEIELGEDVEQWAARARAAVFAGRTHAEGERLRIQEEASELAAGVTGEPIVGVSRARRAVEAAVGR